MAQKKTSDGSGKKFLFGAVVGAVTGAVTALLTAPKSGKETRADIKDKAVDITQNALREIRKLEGELNKQISNSKRILPHLTGDAKEELEALIRDAQRVKDKALKTIDGLKKGNKKQVLDAGLIEEMSRVIDHLGELSEKVNKGNRTKRT